MKRNLVLALNKILNFLFSDKLILLLALVVSLFCFYYYSELGLHIAYGDATSRLNIARKVIDNLTPGLAQFGNIWLPLPQMIMLIFIWQDKLWHTGLAGYFMSGSSFILMAFYLYRIGKEGFNSKLVGLIALLASFANINILYMQTTAMSEILFLACITGATYHIFRWAKEDSIAHLLAGAVFISASTLTRYEGYFVFFSAILIVAIVSIIKHKSKKKLEGNIVLFGTLAITGIIAWALYSWAIFGDPFYWKNIYSHEKSIISTDLDQFKYLADSGGSSEKKDFLVSLLSVFNAVFWMNGLFIVIIGILGILSYIWYLIKINKLKDNISYFTLILPLSAIIFVLFSIYASGLPLNVPEVSWINITTRNTSLINEYNIRYGLNLFPFLVIMIVFLASRSMFARYLVLLFLVFQIYTTYFTPLSTIYQLPVKLAGAGSSANTGRNEASVWLKNNYDDGLILISALKHDPEMFYMGFPYSTYIHEGTGKYWLTSRGNPTIYAKWIFMFKQKRRERW